MSLRDPYAARTEPRLAWRLVPFALGLLVLAITVGFLSVRARWRAAEVERAVDARILAIEADVSAAVAAREQHAALLAEIDALRARLAEIERRLPCSLDTAEIVPLLRAALEPQGIVLHAELGWRQRREELDEVRIPIVLAEGPDSERRVREALAGLEQVVLVEPYGTDERQRIVVVVAQASCPREAPPLPAQAVAVPGRELVGWPFDAGVREREARVKQLLAERARLAVPLGDREFARQLREQLESAEARLAAWPSHVATGGSR